MKHIRTCCIILLAAALCFGMFACAQPQNTEETQKQDAQIDSPYNDDGTCYTQSVLLPEGFDPPPLARPRLTTVGDTLILTDTEEHAEAFDPLAPSRMAYVWDLSANLLDTVEIPPLLTRPQTILVGFQHIPCEDGGAVQLLCFQHDPQRYYSPDDAQYNDPVTNEVVLAAQNPDGSLRFTLDVDALFNDGYTHLCTLLRDGVTGYIYLHESSETLILDADGTLLDRIPWEHEARSDFIYTADNRVYLADRDTLNAAEHAYLSYDPQSHAFVEAVSPVWSGYDQFPVGADSWYERNSAGFYLRTQQEDGTYAEQLLVNWLASGFSNGSIRKTFVNSGADGHLRVTAFTKDFDTGRMSLTLFDPYAPCTVPERNTLHLYADETWHTLQEAAAAFNAENALYRIVYTDDPAKADLLYVCPTQPLSETVDVLDLHAYLDTDMFVRPQSLIPGMLNAFVDDGGALQMMPVRTSLSLSCAGGDGDKFDILTSPADYLCAVLTHELLPQDAEIEPVIAFAIPSTADDPDGAWKFIRYLLLSENEETVFSGADEGFSVWRTLFDYQLSRMDGAYALRRGNGYRFTFAYPRGEDPETFDPMTDANFAAGAVEEGAYYVRFDRDQRAVLEGFFGIVTN